MASRRLAISSLLCDDDASSSSPQSHEAPPYVSASSPSWMPPASPPIPPHRDAHRPSSSYSLPASAHSAFGAAGRRISSFGDRRLASDIDVHGPGHQHSQSPPRPVPLALQPAPMQHRTPSPPPVSLPPSPQSYQNVRHDYYSVENHSVPGAYGQQDYHAYPHDAGAPYAIPTARTYSQYSSPPSSSPESVNEPSVSRATLPVSSFRYSPPVLRRPLPAVDTTHTNMSPIASSSYHNSGPSHSSLILSSSAHHHTPQDALMPVHYTSRTADDRRLGHIPAQARLAHSPTMPGPLSGLDALVQAAAVERERIDEHRRASGGSDRHVVAAEERAHEWSTISTVGDSRVGQASSGWSSRPVQLQGHVEQPPADQPKIVYNLASHPARPVKRRRSTPEPSSPPYHCPGSPVISPRYHDQYIDSPPRQIRLESPVAIAHEQSHSTVYTPVEPQVTSRIEELTLSHTSVRLHPIPSPAHFSQPDPCHSAGDELTVTQRRSSAHPSLTIAQHPIAHGRRSPPRSKPKPKLKPGSAALSAAMEPISSRLSHQLNPPKSSITSRGVAPYVARHPYSPLAGTSHFDRQKKDFSQKTSSRSSSSRVFVKEEEEDDKDGQDAHDFFLSAFDSPHQQHTTHVNSTLGPSNDSSSRLQHEIFGNLSRGYPKERASNSNVPPDSDVDDEIAHAVGGSSVADNSSVADLNDLEDDLVHAVEESVETGSELVDKMDVEVEDELLSLIEPSQMDSAPPSHAMPHAVRLPDRQGLRGLSQESMDRLSMPPPPPTTKVGKMGSKDPKPVLSKEGQASDVKGKSGTSAQGKGNKKLLKAEESSFLGKTAKPKMAPKLKPKVSSDKLKKDKVIGGTNEVLPSSGSPAAVSPNLASDESFPVVTSSGRMVKKSFASTFAAQSVAKKKPAAFGSVSGGNDASSSRSRSLSAIPRASVDPEPRQDKEKEKEKSAKIDDDKGKEDEEVAEEDDKLYCICKTTYDEDRVMIACDRCDEWYHTECVKMRELDVDLVDQFICPLCIKRNPSLHLKTTYKQRCFAGLKHPKPTSEAACHKPARGAYSKYCSDECGVKYVQMKLRTWAAKGGDVKRLWETVKDTKRREGSTVVESGKPLPKTVLAELSNCYPTQPGPKTSGESITLNGKHVNPELWKAEVRDATPQSPHIIMNLKQQRVEELEVELQKVQAERESRERDSEVLGWRRQLLMLAIARAERMGECGWDQRLCFGDEEWREFGGGVLESYDEARGRGRDGMEVDGEVSNEGEWWCRGKRKCERHVGWQKIRERELANEREEEDEALDMLNTTERKIKLRIEDLSNPSLGIKKDGHRSMTKGLNGDIGGKEGGKKKKKGMR